MDPISTGKGAQAGRLHERPPAGQVSGQDFWRRYFTFYDTLNEAIPYQQMIRRHVDLLRPLPQEEILDAGTGNLALALLACGARVTGIDYVEAALDICRRQAPGVEFLFGDLTRRLELADSRFEAGGFQVELMETTLASQCLLALARKPAAGSGCAPPESVR